MKKQSTRSLTLVVALFSLVLSLSIALAPHTYGQGQRRRTTSAPASQRSSTAAQRPPAQNDPRATSARSSRTTERDVEEADVAITATVRARELRFEQVPNPTVEFTGQPERRTAWEADRENLPPSVEPGVTYRDIGIRLRIISRFADIERIVAEALGEIPVTETSPTQEPSPDTSIPSPPNTPANRSPISQSSAQNSNRSASRGSAAANATATTKKEIAP